MTTETKNDATDPPMPTRKVFGLLTVKRKPIVSVLRLGGVIGGGGLGRRGLTLDALELPIQRAFSMSNVDAVALEINSPGGSPVQSDLIAGRIRDWADEKKLPVIAFCEDAAASGGYWLACAADEIYAMPGSIVGSIGVISSGFGFVDAIAKLGVERRVYTAGESKSILDPFKPEKEEDIETLKHIQKDLHDQFKAWVKDRRGDTLDEDADLFTGAFWTGREAMTLGLVDGLGDRRSVMRARFGSKTRFRSVIRPKSRLQRMLGVDAGKGLVPSAVDALTTGLDENAYWRRLGL